MGRMESEEKGARDKVTNRRRGKEGVEWGGALNYMEGGLNVNVCAGVPPPPR